MARLLRAIPCVLVLAIVCSSCTAEATPAVGSTSTVGTSAASTSIMQTALPESVTSAADSEPVDIPITPAGDPVLVNEPTAGATAVLVVSGDQFDQLSVSIPVGGVVTFRAGDDAAHAIIVGELSSVTVIGGLEEYYQFPLTGTFEITDELSAAKATVLVS